MKFHLQADISLPDIEGDPTGAQFVEWLRGQIIEHMGGGQLPLSLGSPFDGLTLDNTMFAVDKVGAVRLD